MCAPVFFIIAFNGDNLLRPFALAPEVQDLSVQFWQPHMLSFEPGKGWGAIGGWVAALTYIVMNSLVLLLRWRSPAWERIRLR